MNQRFHGRDTIPYARRYSRIPGDTTVFHVVDAHRDPAVEVRWWEGDDLLHARLCPNTETHRLANAVVEAKASLGGTGGGGFLIDEFGRVIVPSPNGEGRRVLCGIWEGPLVFEHPDGYEWDAFDDSGLTAGDRWDGPYVGSAYNLSNASEIYWWDRSEETKELPKAQDHELVRRIRSVRRRGAVRFIAAPGGIVLTKVPDDSGEWDPEAEEDWVPVYVGRIDPARWFAP